MDASKKAKEWIAALDHLLKHLDDSAADRPLTVEHILGMIRAERNGLASLAGVERLPEPIRVICAWCKVEISPGSEPVSHGICSECAAEMRDTMAKPDDKMGPE